MRRPLAFEAATLSRIRSPVAVRDGLCDHYTARMLPLAYLSPAIVEQILDGRQPPAATLGALTAQPLPRGWAAQQAVFDRLASGRAWGAGQIP